MQRVSGLQLLKGRRQCGSGWPPTSGARVAAKAPLSPAAQGLHFRKRSKCKRQRTAAGPKPAAAVCGCSAIPPRSLPHDALARTHRDCVCQNGRLLVATERVGHGQLQLEHHAVVHLVLRQQRRQQACTC